jgi:hypothetical protein
MSTKLYFVVAVFLLFVISSVSLGQSDEQMAEVFATNMIGGPYHTFNTLAYNVTAIQQSAQDNIGPAYLLNGLVNGSNSIKYWYQVGVSWNWVNNTVSGPLFHGFRRAYPPNGVMPSASASSGGIENIVVKLPSITPCIAPHTLTEANGTVMTLC